MFPSLYEKWGVSALLWGFLFTIQKELGFRSSRGVPSSLESEQASAEKDSLF